MNALKIDFDDAIFKETGISKSAIAMREEVLTGDNGRIYTLQVVKKNAENQDTLYICLKNRAGLPIEDLKIKAGACTIGIDAEKSQDSVVIEGLGHELLKDMEILSKSADVQRRLQIEMEKPRELPPKKARKRKSKKMAEKSKRLLR